MSLIKHVSVYSHCNDLQGKVWNPAIRWTAKHAVFVELEDEHGVRGIGECWCFDSAPDALVAFLKTEVIPHFIGIDAMQFEAKTVQLQHRATLTARHGILSSALSGLDIAAWDLRSRQAELPLFKYLNQMAEPVVDLYASGGLYANGKTQTDLVTEMKGLVNAGFYMVKMKVGAQSLTQDISRALAVCDALPASVKIIIDGVYSYTAEQARKLYSQLPKERIEAFQAPVAAADINTMIEMTRSGIPVMVAEAEYREEVHRELIEREAVAFLQSSPIACGGISKLIELREQMNNTTMRMSLEVSSTAIALMAACHVAAAYDIVAHVEWHSVHTVFYHDLQLLPIEGLEGRFSLPELPGLGIELAIDTLKKELIVNA